MNLVNNIDLDKLPKPYLSQHTEWVELYNFAWELAAKNIRECNGQRYMDCAWDFSRNFQWVWDTCFVALYARYDNGIFPGISSLDNFYKNQREDGFIAMTYDLNTGKEVYGERINPPLFAWVEWEYYQTTGNSSRFQENIPKIEKLMDWIDKNRRCEPRKIRLKVPQQPRYTGHEKGHNGTGYPFYYFADCGSSGMDDSPRTPRNPEAGKHYDWIDLSSQMVLSFQLLAKMHKVLGNSEKVTYWNSRATELKDAINKELWCERVQFYLDRSDAPNFVNSKTAASFWTLLANIAEGDKLDSLIWYLNDPKTFNRPIPVPTLAADDCNYCESGTYWIGGVWAPTNYMITRGLMKVGKNKLAYEIAVKYLNGLSDVYQNLEPHSLWECYCAEKPAPSLNPYDRQYVKPDFVGWTGIGPIAMLIENIMGLDIKAPESQIIWTINLQEDFGIKNLKVGNAKVSLDCKFNNNIPTITIDSSAEINIKVIFNDQEKNLIVKNHCQETITE